MAKKKKQLYPRASFTDSDGHKHYYDNLTAGQMAKILDDMGHRLLDLHGAGANHISRKDNNELFEVSFFLKECAERIKTKYPSSDY